MIWSAEYSLALKFDTSRTATMDHRGLLKIGNQGFITIGGMTAGQEVTGDVVCISQSEAAMAASIISISCSRL